MTRPIRHADLVARALDALADEERVRVDRALEADPALRQHFEAVAGHLLTYEQLPPAPPPPAFGRLARALDDDVATPDPGVLRLQRAHPPRRWLGPAVATAALVLVAVLLYGPLNPPSTDPQLVLVPGAGMLLVRAGERVPAPAQARLAVAPGDVLHCDETAAEARLGERVRVVLDGGARLRIDGGAAVTLQRGRAWFEVRPGAFEVRTAYGPVRVIGTAFEVDVRSGGLEVAVAHGEVLAAGHGIRAGSRLRAGALVVTDPRGAGAWFGRPRLLLESGPGPHASGQPLALTLVFENAGNVPLTLPGPAAARAPLWISFETAEGRVLGELPVRESNVTAGREVLRPGSGLHLEPGARQVVTLKILPPVGSPGAYRCRALYRPAGRPGVLSTPLDVEVR